MGSAFDRTTENEDGSSHGVKPFAEASTSEEPGAGIPHAGICAGGAGNRPSPAAAKKGKSMKCPSCGYEEKYDAKVCSFCNAILQPDEEEAHGNQGDVRGLPPHVLEKMRKEKAAQQLLEQRRREDEAKEKALEDRRRKRLKGHAITGALTFAILNILLGLPGSLHPLRLVVILLLSAVFGLPLGYLISFWGGGLMKGAVISSGAFVLLRIVLSVPALFQSSSPGIVLFYAVLGGVLAGAIPGAIIGWHVDLDRT